MSTINVERANSPTIFELINEPMFDIHELPFAKEAAQVAHNLGSMAMRFARIERVPRYDEHNRENDAEHSFMLALVATELAASYYSDLDIGLVGLFSVVHDLVELETNDVATFTLSDAELAEKEAAELAAVDAVAGKLPAFWRQIFLRYEQQVEPETRFVRLVDKVLPLISNIEGPGRKVMAEDYDIYTVEQLDANENRFSRKLRERFPEAYLDFLHYVRDTLAAKFSEQMADETV